MSRADRFDVQVQAQVAGGDDHPLQMSRAPKGDVVVEAHHLEDAVAAQQAFVRDRYGGLGEGHDASIDASGLHAQNLHCQPTRCGSPHGNGALLVGLERAAHGPLPVLLVLLCLVTGFVDATCYIALGRVFVANMTGNVVLLGFAIGGAPGLSASGSLAALGAFVVGSILGGRIAHHYRAHRGRHMSVGAASAGVSLALALVAAIAIGEPIGAGARFALITPLGHRDGDSERDRAAARGARPQHDGGRRTRSPGCSPTCA